MGSETVEILQTFLEVGAWVQFFLVCSAYYLLKFVLYLLPSRVLRMVTVCIRGWPPAHLDADGDWNPEPKK